jgi:hypothetical protein
MSNVHLAGQLGDDGGDHLRPGLTIEAPVGEVGVEEGGDDAARAVDAGGLLVGEVAHAHLDELGDARHVVEHVGHDGRVRPGEALVRGAEVGVGVEVEHAHPREALGVGLDAAEGDGVVAADEGHELAAVEPPAHLAVDEVVHLAAEEVDLGEGGGERGGARDVTPDGDHLLGEGAGLAVAAAHPVGLGRHRDARLVGAARLPVVEVDLSRGAEHRRGPLLRPAAVRRRRRERDGDHHHPGLLRRVG